MEKWLAPTDGSPSAIKAVAWAARRSKMVQGGVELTLLSVAEDTTASLMIGAPDAFIVDATLIEALAEQGQQAAQDALNRSLAAAQAEGITPVTLLARGIPRQVICDEAQRGGYDLIVMGSRGLGGLAELVLGSVSHHVVQHASTPVLIVR